MAFAKYAFQNTTSHSNSPVVVLVTNPWPQSTEIRRMSLILGFILLAFASCKGLGNSTVPPQATAKFTFDKF